MSDLFSHLDPAASPQAGSGMAAQQRATGMGQAALAAPVAAAARPEAEDSPASPCSPASPASPAYAVAALAPAMPATGLDGTRDVLTFYVEGWAPTDAPAWEWRMKVEPVEAVARVLKTLRRRPEHVEIRTLRLGDLGVFSAGPGEPKRPLAFIPIGLELDEACAGLRRLTPNPAERRA